MPIKNLSHNEEILITFYLPIVFPHVPIQVKKLIIQALCEIPEIKINPMPVVNLIKIESPKFEYEINF